MVSKNQMSFIQKLHQKKHRESLKLFIAEGPKVVQEFLSSGFKCEIFCALANNTTFALNDNVCIVSEVELRKMSALVTPNECLGVFHIPERDLKFSGRGLIADGLRDPGNLGTLIRLCDWFHIRTLVLSNDSVDCYNPKVVQSSMGSLARVQVIYEDLNDWLPKQNLPVMGALLNGNSIYEKALPVEGWLLVGSESHGISDALIPFIKHRITIPRFDAAVKTESLNVATATAIILGEWTRKLHSV
jgi:RNA methyltransferase, TrmH family